MAKVKINLNSNIHGKGCPEIKNQDKNKEILQKVRMLAKDIQLKSINDFFNRVEQLIDNEKEAANWSTIVENTFCSNSVAAEKAFKKFCATLDEGCVLCSLNTEQQLNQSNYCSVNNNILGIHSNKQLRVSLRRF